VPGEVLSQVNAPAPRYCHSAVWDGRDLLFWGGTEDDESSGIPRITPRGDGMFLRL
jgi:hypothetical protein